MADEAPAAATPTENPVVVEPASIQVPAAGGNSTLQLQNTSAEVRYSFKVKSTNNDNYRVNPVFGFVEPGAASQVDVNRLEGPPKGDDRLELLFLPVEPAVTDPKAPFVAGGSPEFKVDIPMNAM